MRLEIAMIDSDKIFGIKKPLPVWQTRNPAVVIRHGIFSSKAPFVGLQTQIDNFFLSLVSQ